MGRCDGPPLVTILVVGWCEVSAHGFGAGDHGGVGVGGDHVDDGVGEDFLVDSVVPVGGRQLRAEDRGTGPVASVHEGVELPDLFHGRCCGEPVVDDEQVGFDEVVHGLAALPGLVGQAELVEQVLGWQIEHTAVLLACFVAECAGEVGLPGPGGALQDDVLVSGQVGAHAQTGEELGV